MGADDNRAAFRRWLELNGLSPFSAAKAAGISPGTIYNFLSGLSESLSTGVLEKLAKATNQPISSILTGEAPSAPIRVLYRVGAMGKMFPTDDEYLTVERPPGIPATEGVSAAVIEGDGLMPIPSGWYVFFRTDPQSPETLVNQMAVVRYNGGGDKPFVRTLRRGGVAGLFTLQTFSGSLVEDVEVVAAHQIISFAKPE
jgi:transcriptional regulator with XRE-family HTH domain